METPEVPPNQDTPLQLNLGKNIHFTGDSMADLGKLAVKLTTVREEVDYINKSGENDHHGYTYITERDLTEKLREPLNELDIMLFTSVEEKGTQNDLTKVVTEHAFVDGGTGASIVVKGRGYGQDGQDKGVYIAVTGAVKYMLYKNFLVPAGDDPEKPPSISDSKRKKIFEGASKFGLDRSTFVTLLGEHFGISNVTQIRPGQVGGIKKMIRDLGTHPNQQGQPRGDGQPPEDGGHPPEDPEPSEKGGTPQGAPPPQEE